MTFIEAIQRQIDQSRTRYKKNGWEFKERTLSTHNLGDFIGAVLAIDNEADASEFYRGYIEWLEVQPDRKVSESAKYVADANIGWCFGEGMSDERKAMWEKCTTASHPIFGRHRPSPDEALAAGIKAGQDALPR